MKITYAKDTDTLYIRFNNHTVVSSTDVGNDVILEQDEKGFLVTMTVKHAHNHTEIAGFSFNQVNAMRAL